MTEQIFEWLRENIEATGMFKKTFGLAEIVHEGKISYPVVYDKKGELIPVHEMDIDKGISYFRIKEISKEQITSTTGYNDLIFVYDCLQVCTLRKAKIKDNKYSSQRLAELMWATYYALSLPTASLPVKAQNIMFEPRRTETGLNVLKTEYGGFGNTLNENFDTSVIKISFRITVQISYNCFLKTIS